MQVKKFYKSILLLLSIMISSIFGANDSLAIRQVLNFMINDNSNTLEIDFSKNLGAFNPNISLSGGVGDQVMNNPEFWTSLRDSFKILKPKLMRINIFDVLYQAKHNYTLHWEDLDSAISNIIKLGAKPFITLFPTPTAIWYQGNPYNIPSFVDSVRWNQYDTLCKEISQHLVGLNLPGLYYEVWNEPDGMWAPVCQSDTAIKWKLYNKLYKYSAYGILAGDNTAKIGGPTTSPVYIENFLIEFIKDPSQLNFISWHWYNADLNFSNYTRQGAEKSLEKYNIPHANMEYIISEYNINSSNNDMNDAFYNAGNLAKTQDFFRADSKLFGFFFLPRDLDLLSGGFGAFTYAPNNYPKPFYNFFNLYSKMDGIKVKATNYASKINAWASKNDTAYRILLWSFDRSHQFSDRLTTMLMLKNIPNGQYTQRNYLIDSKNGNFKYDLQHGKTPVGVLKATSKNVPIQGNLTIHYELENGGVELIEFRHNNQ
jgi:hypothetical protein